MRNHRVLAVLLVGMFLTWLLPFTVTAAAAPPSQGRRVDSTAGATPNYRTFLTQDLKGMPLTGGNYTILKSKAPHTYYDQDWYGVNLSYLLDV